MPLEATNWDLYYARRVGFANITRTVTRRKLRSILSRFLPNKPLKICEFGGGNSCVIDVFARTFDVENYHIVDTNAYGLSLLEHLELDFLTSQQADVLAMPQDYEGVFDCVLSIGLVEHFDQAGTSDAINTHVKACKEGGYVLITYPTPTLLYRIIRKIAEWLGVWAFPDERPLHHEEVLTALRPHGDIILRTTNWWIGLTQGIVLMKKETGKPA